jgi:hypothetical protein
VDESKVGGLTKLAQPWDLVFMDHLESKTRGRLGHTSGRREIDKLCGSLVFCDAASHYIHVEHQVSLPMKQSFQRPSLSVLQVKWSRFRLPPDNGVSAEEFMKELHPRDKVSSSLVLEPSGRMELLRTQSRLHLESSGTDDPRFPSLARGV